MMSLDIQNDYLEFASILDDKYYIIDTIGFGRYAKVKLAINMEDKQKYAIKIMKTDPTTSQCRSDTFINEISTQAEFDHKHIIRIIYCRMNGNYKKIDGRIQQVSYFVMELANQGELFQLLEQTQQFSEKFARNIFLQLIKGIEHLHERGVVHRDVKAENILFSNGVLKLADFGFSTKTIDEKGSRIQFEISQHIGSPEYNPPELYNIGKQKFYNPEQADIFAAGVILFTMVIRSAPFKTSKSTDPYYSLLKNNKQSFWKIFSEIADSSAQFKDLIEKMLDENPLKRITIEQIKQHPWIQGQMFGQTEFQKELKNRYDMILSQQIVKITNKRDTKFSTRKSIKKVETDNISKNVQKQCYENIELIDKINAKLQIKQHSPKEQFKQQSNKSEKLKVGIQQKQQNQYSSRTNQESKRSSPGSPSNDSDN
ncbi:unnamed protein product [Paramecium pentaurelia]|uniref:Protein kinase domain-containing protein n=1 Tax=Paramecium pentaurelia TaxID=43138 RepID=A0A8S1WZ02_9CILI|nr:unnamed protein product [Paramecium pentaurelia]